MAIVLILFGSIIGFIFSSVQLALGLSGFLEALQSYFIFGLGYPVVTLALTGLANIFAKLASNQSFFLSQVE